MVVRVAGRRVLQTSIDQGISRPGSCNNASRIEGVPAATAKEMFGGRVQVRPLDLCQDKSQPT